MASRPLYLGPLGTALTAIRAPQPGMDRSPSAGEGVHELLAGGYATDRSPHLCRQWQMSWGWDDDTWWILSGFASGQLGIGPYAMYEPAMVNLLTPNQASGTEAFKTTLGFSCDATEALASTSTFAQQARRSLKWSLPASVTSGILTLAAPQSLIGWPVAPSSYAFSAYCRTGASGDTSFSVTMALRWLDAAGAQVSESVNTASTVTTAFVQLSLSASPPATAVYVVPRIKVTAASVSAGADLHIDQAQLQLGGTVTTWRSGEGPALVGLGRLRETVPLATGPAPGQQARIIQATLTQLGVAA